MKPVVSFSRRSALLGALGAGAVALLPRSATAQAAPSKPLNASSYRFKIGSIEAISFSDGVIPFAPVQPTFAPEGKSDEVTKALEAGFHPTDKVPMNFNILLLQYGKNKVLVDSGSGSLLGPAAGLLANSLSAAGVGASDITGIILSHAHRDHYGGLLDTTGGVAFPNATIYINETELNFWTSPEPALPRFRMDEATKQTFIEGAKKYLGAVKQQIKTIKPGETILDTIDILEAAGHTPGHIALQISDGKEALTHIADLAHNHVLMFAHPEWTVMFDADPAMAIASRKKLFKRISDARSRVYGYHLPFPGIGHIRSLENGFEWVAEPWML